VQDRCSIFVRIDAATSADIIGISYAANLVLYCHQQHVPNTEINFALCSYCIRLGDVVVLRNYLCVVIWQTMGCKVLAQGGLRGLPPSLIHGMSSSGAF
jgi:hypothetical protein